MAEHFKLEITNRSTKITTWTGVPVDFADEYRMNLLGPDDSYSDDTEHKPMTDAMATVFSVANKPFSEDNKDEENEEETPATNESTKKNDGKYAKYNYAKRVKQRRSKFKTLAYINFMVPNVQFVTLTFDSRIFDNADDLATCHKAFQKFIKRVRHQYADFHYLAVFSRQQNKHWHYHMICNFDETVSGKNIHEMWSYGIVHNTVLTRHDEFESKISYCIDNMEQVAWDDLQGEKGYLSSKGLQNKIVLRSWNENESDMAFECLREILGTNDKPLPIGNIEIQELLSAYETKHLKEKNPNGKISATKSFNINYWISQKGFTDLFDKPVVAKKK